MPRPHRVLFVCSRNRRRSPTAEAVASAWPGIEALSAGTAPVAVLGIPDDYDAMDLALVRLLHERLGAVLGPLDAPA